MLRPTANVLPFPGGRALSLWISGYSIACEFSSLTSDGFWKSYDFVLSPAFSY